MTTINSHCSQRSIVHILVNALFSNKLRLLAAYGIVAATATGCSKSQQASAPEAVTTVIQTRILQDALATALTYQSGKEDGLNTILESLGGGVGIFDLERDGSPDLYFTGGGGISIDSVSGAKDQLLRLVRGRFVDQSEVAVGGTTGFYSHGLAVTDFNSDGFDDLVVSGFGGLVVWQNNGDGTLVNAATAQQLDAPNWSTSVACADLNLDGFSDLYVCHYVNWSLHNNPTCTGVSGGGDVCPPRAFESLDDSLFLNSGNGGFSLADAEFAEPRGGKGLGVVAADFDKDGDTDIYVANDTTENFLYRNDGGKRLTEMGFASGAALDASANANGSMGVAITDFDGDGATDIFVANYEDEVFALYQNLGDMSFVHASDRFGVSSLGSLYVGFGSVASDLDLDGDEDLVVNNGHVVHFPKNAPLRQEPLLLRHLGNRYERIQDENNSFTTEPRMGRGLAKIDWNIDGKEDLLFCNSDEPSVLIENTSVTAGRSLRFELIGIHAERKVVGMTVTVHLQDDRKLVRNTYGGGSYLSQSQQVVHFGIPEGVGISHVTFHWPGGVVHSMRPCDFDGQFAVEGIHIVLEPPKGVEAARNYLQPF
jgi:hypothetical protein